MSKGEHPVRTVRRAMLLQQMDQGKTTVEAAQAVGISAKTAWEIAKRYLQGGLERAIYDAPRPGQKPLLSFEQDQRIIAMVCGSPPEGRARWSLRLIAEESVKRKIVGRVSHHTIRLVLQHHDLKPWREKNVVCGGVGSRVHTVHGGRAQGVRKASLPPGTRGVRG
ncbi:MAG: helix-turn-helix domain-containing protein [Acidobacteriaceae bacterium]|nr:helix-turn-helix domain-containing protein [Acidobacteriaceae bacterium]